MVRGYKPTGDHGCAGEIIVLCLITSVASRLSLSLVHALFYFLARQEFTFCFVHMGADTKRGTATSSRR
jgi:hypothetical protein